MASGYALPQANGALQPARLTPSGPASDPFSDIGHTSHSHGHHDTSNGYAPSSKLPMKGRLRGESDLSRPSGIIVPAKPSLWMEIFTGAALTAQYLLLGTAATGGAQEQDRTPAWRLAGLATTAVLISAGLVGRVLAPAEKGDKRRLSNADGGERKTVGVDARMMVRTVVGTGLPLYAACVLEKEWMGLVLVAAIVSMSILGLAQQGHSSWRKRLARSGGFWTAVGLAMGADLMRLTSSASWYDVCLGYLCLAMAVLIIPPPLLEYSTSKPGLRPLKLSVQSPSLKVRPTVVATKAASTSTLLSGVVVGTVTLLASVITRSLTPVDTRTLTVIVLSAITSCAAVFLGDLASLRSRRRAGLLTGLVIILADLQFTRTGGRVKMLANCGAAVAIVLGAAFDSSSSLIPSSNNSAIHTGRKHQHGNVSFLTSFLLSKTRSGSLIYDILSEKDSRRIAYFTW